MLNTSATAYSSASPLNDLFSYPRSVFKGATITLTIPFLSNVDSLDNDLVPFTIDWAGMAGTSGCVGDYMGTGRPGPLDGTCYGNVPCVFECTPTIVKANATVAYAPTLYQGNIAFQGYSIRVYEPVSVGAPVIKTASKLADNKL